MRIAVTLDWYEIRLAAHVGIERRIRSRERGLPMHGGHGGNAGWQSDIDGACGELAVAKALNLHWQGSIDKADGADVGPLEVRWSDQHYHRLIIRPDDVTKKGHRKFVLVTGVCPDYIVHGWYLGNDVTLHPEWIEVYNGQPEAHFVPQEFLHPVKTKASL